MIRSLPPGSAGTTGMVLKPNLLKPPPVAEAGRLAADLLFCIPEGPDPGLVDHESPSFAADANAAIVLHCIEAFGLAQCAAAFRPFAGNTSLLADSLT